MYIYIYKMYSYYQRMLKNRCKEKYTEGSSHKYNRF